MEGEIGFVQSAPHEKQRVKTMWNKGMFTYTEEGMVGEGFIYNCKFERGGLIKTAPTIHSTPRLAQENAENRFADFVAQWA